MSDTESAPPTPLLYVTDFGDPADLFDIAYLLRSPEHDLRGVCRVGDGDGERILDALAAAQGVSIPRFGGAAGVREALETASEPLSLVVVGGYEAVAGALREDPTLFRSNVARLFLVGGYVNDYTGAQEDPGTERAGPERLPTNPRLREMHPERFAGALEARAGTAFGTLLTSGEGVIWLPRDVSLWRFAAPGMLGGGGPVAELLLRETGGQTVLLSTLPAVLLAHRPDPFAWMRLFRAVTARVAVEESGAVKTFTTRTDAPNLYVVVAVDGTALSRLVAAGLRDHPLVPD